MEQESVTTLFGNTEEELSYWKRRFAVEAEMDRVVSQLDPLHADDFFRNILPEFNHRMAPSEIMRMTSFIIPPPEEVDKYDLLSARASLRDLGMIAASLRRHDVQVDEFSQLRDMLIRLSEITGEVPRDTVFSYGPRNPRGSRQRRFTKRTEEAVFIRSFVSGMDGLWNCIMLLPALLSLPVASSDFLDVCKELTKQFQAMVSAIIQVRTHVPPEIFTVELRPYFDPIKINGTEYLAPGGAQMPMLIIDQILWGNDCTTPSYLKYDEENLPYLPPFLREFSTHYKGRKSIVTMVDEGYGKNEHALASSEREGVQMVSNLLTRVMSFRAPHQRVAEANFALRSRFALGSGGYTPALLGELIEKTKQAQQTLRAVLRKKG